MFCAVQSRDPTRVSVRGSSRRIMTAVTRVKVLESMFQGG
jgi:hypothetical protein